MSHAVIKAGGKQFLVTEGQTIRVPSMAADAGSSIELEPLISSGGGDGKISATVVAHGKDQKIVVLIPSTTITSSARFIRAIASSRVRA